MDVDEDGVTFTLVDRHRRLSSVRLQQEIGLPGDDLEFARGRGEWRLRLDRPDVDRMEYLFELTDRNERRSTVTDPANPQRAPGAFGDKSVVVFPGYRPPAWLTAPAFAATTTPLELDAPRLDGVVDVLLWSPQDLDADEPAPLLLVHDGPEFAELG